MSGPTHQMTPSGKIFELPQNDRENALRLASGLAWAVGKLEGMEVDPGYAGQVLDWWRTPVRVVDPESTS